MIALKQNTASQEIILGPFLDNLDGDTEETALSIANTDIKIWKNGATTLANKNSGGATHISNGIYYTVLDATDTNTLGPLVIFIHKAGALYARVECNVYAANIYDSLYGATDKLDVNVEEWNATSVPTEHTAGYPIVTIKSGTGNGEVDLAAGAVTIDPTSLISIGDSVWTANGSPVLLSGDVLSSTSTTVVLDISTGNLANDYFNGSTIIVFDTLTAEKQTRIITDYDDSTATITVDRAWDANPSTSFEFYIHASSTAPSASTIADAVWDEATSGHIATGTFGIMMQPIRSGTAQAGAASTITLDASASVTNDFYNKSLLMIVSGTGVGQARIIADYVGSTKVATVAENWTVNPDNTSVFVILPFGSDASVIGATVSSAVWDAPRSSYNTAGTFGQAVARVEGDIGGNLNGDVLGDVNVNITSLAAGSITASTFATGAIDSNAIADSAIDKFWDEIMEAALTARQALRLFLSALTGLTTGGGTSTVKFRDTANTKDRITATVDTDGNRTAITRDAS